MNVLFFLLPKSEVAYIHDDCTVRQALEKVRHYGYTAIPVLNDEEQYVGTVTEGDFLRFLLNNDCVDIKETEHTLIKDMPRKLDNKAVCVDATLDDLLLLTMNQNFVPVTDDRMKFIGIVTRKDIIRHFSDKDRQKVLE